MRKPIRNGLWIGGAVLTGLASMLVAGVLRLPSVPALSLAASIGGPFTLTTHLGERFTAERLKGKPFAIFFGFTQCPDVCPTTLLDISNHLRDLGKRANRINVLFVSVDHERDSVEHLKAYLASFDPRIIGLTGSSVEIADIVRAYRVVYQKVPTSGGYTINHTASVFLMNSQGRFAGTLSFQEPPENQLAKLRKLAEE